ncbi:MAG: hypothetical protein VBE63_28550 [Lamprobacter sp.]|uniref:hypothetical protein n=1 Tax=Lamprobacter sp. TaxID=3100796 RepID=UPI002B264677|nr:hypothetical protein [Lamprobacter sp.]MEA3643846.1 hypothetical protein [Lamprobacter sp.]
MTAETQATDTSDKPDYDSPWKEALEQDFPEFLVVMAQIWAKDAETPETIFY